jgi:branched-chain amino acid transport system substrate-binding protein
MEDLSSKPSRTWPRWLMVAGTTIALSTGALSFGSVAQDASPIEIGVAVSLTGYLAANDGQFVSGLKLASDELNKTGGIAGHPINLHILDNASNATTGVTVTNQLLNQYDITVMLTGVSSGQNQAIGPILASSEIPMIAYSAQLPTEQEWAFQVSTPVANLIDRQLEFAKQKFGAKKIAYLYSNTPYGQGGAKYIAEKAAAFDLELVISEPVEATASDLTPQLAKIKDTNPDAVLDLLTGSTHIVEAKAAATVGLTVPLIMAYDDSTTATQSTEAYPETYLALQPAQAYPDIVDAELKASVEKFKVIFDAAGLDVKTINGVASGWDAIHILAQAVEASGSVGGPALRDALEKISYVGASSIFNFTPEDHSGQRSSTDALQFGHYDADGVKLVPFAN